MVEKTLTKELFPNRSWEREILNPLVGKSMLELGNKRKGDMVYKAVFESLGFRHVSIDMNGSDGALPFDLREPLDLGTFDMVTNFGTSEHVSVNDYDGQVACWQNIVNATHDGSVLVSVTPRPNVSRWSRHGRWYPEEEFYNLLASLNGFEAERVYRDKYLIYARLVRHTVTDFRMPTKGMFINDASLKMAGCS
jgi:hypothetical protein